MRSVKTWVVKKQRYHVFSVCVSGSGSVESDSSTIGTFSATQNFVGSLSIDSSESSDLIGAEQIGHWDREYPAENGFLTQEWQSINSVIISKISAWMKRSGSLIILKRRSIMNESIIDRAL